ncbi:Acyltransferase-like protein, chloroplastic [Quillaja saponaria]|uniref:Acyltransferase-like protein, chloroplastic n=1 Tax=Quillaja saponaria TaxID=32244 RepID=A0AAD7Q7G2_QUISA|nr:Acyltransferase-like protein, chloroplastic [Quillaja saponaria]
MTATRARVFPAVAGSLALIHCGVTSLSVGNSLKSNRIPNLSRTVSVRTDYRASAQKYNLVEEELETSVNDYFEQSKVLLKSDGGPPRWFSPLECGSRSNNSPLLLFLPGIDGTGLGLILHHQKLGRIFDIWCLHIPVTDRTLFTDLVKLVERTISSEILHSPNRPIYLVGESLGGCLALAVAVRNPHIDIVLILANPATSFSKSQLQLLIPLLEAIPRELSLAFPCRLSLTAADLLSMVLKSLVKGLPLQQTVGELSQNLSTMTSYLSILADMLPRETLLWKLQLIQQASAYVNSRLHDVNSEILLLSSGKDQLLHSQQEGERLRQVLPKCLLRHFDECGHFLFLESGIDLVTIIKATSHYRRAKYHDYISDYMLPTLDEFKKVDEPYKLMDIATSPVILSTLEDGKIVRDLAGIPSEGPVLLVGYHMLLGFEVVPLVTRIFVERDILVRGMAHPMIFAKYKKGKLPDFSQLSMYDTVKLMGAVPVSATNFFRLFSSKSHVLLYPGGMREALHRKGEEYKLFWPEQSEFVRMAARFGAKIVPFAAVGEDDFGEVVFDFDDLMKIPYYRDYIEEVKNETVKLRANSNAEVANQYPHLPGILPKFPGRLYLYFGKPIETEGRKQELRDRKKSYELYLEVKSEVERCIAYLKEKRETDPYRNLFPRLLYQATHCFTSRVPTFEI